MTPLDISASPPSQAGNSPESVLVRPPEEWLSAQAIRSSASAVMARAQANESRHFTWHPERMAVAAAYVVALMKERYPGGQVPLHSVWRHLAAGDAQRWEQVATGHGLSPEQTRLEHARAQVDFAVVAALIGGGQAPLWHYTDASSGQHLSQPPGLSVAALRWMSGGAFSSQTAHPFQVDAHGLAMVDGASMNQAFQTAPTNPLPGVSARVDGLHRLGLALEQHPQLFTLPEAPGVLRPGHLVDTLFRLAPTGRIKAASLLSMLLHAFGEVWHGPNELNGVNLGDCWPHPGAPGGWVAFHQQAQWVAYSLIEPLHAVGIVVTELDALTGLPDLRNGGLLLDLGILQARDRAFHTQRWTLDAEPVVEWRALSVAILDHLAESVRGELGLTVESFPVARLMEAGTWAAGCKIALAKRPAGSPPVQIDSDGAAFFPF